MSDQHGQKHDESSDRGDNGSTGSPDIDGSNSIRDKGHLIEQHHSEDLDVDDLVPISEERIDRIVAKAMELKRQWLDEGNERSCYELADDSWDKPIVPKVSDEKTAKSDQDISSDDYGDDNLSYLQAVRDRICRLGEWSVPWLGPSRTAVAAVVTLAVMVCVVCLVTYWSQETPESLPIKIAIDPSPTDSPNIATDVREPSKPEVKQEQHIAVVPLPETPVAIEAPDQTTSAQIAVDDAPRSELAMKTDETTGEDSQSDRSDRETAKTRSDPADLDIRTDQAQSIIAPDVDLTRASDVAVVRQLPSETGKVDEEAMKRTGVRAHSPFLNQFERQVKNKFGSDPKIVGVHLGNFANLYRDRGRPDLARPLFERASEMITASHGLKSLEYAQLLYDLGLLYRDLGQYDQVIHFNRQALSIRKGYPETDTNTKFILNNEFSIAEALLELGKYNEAMAGYERSRKTSIKVAGFNSKETANALIGKARVCHGRGQYRQALTLYKNGLNIKEKLLPKTHIEIADVKGHIGRVNHDLGKFKEALPLYEESLKVTIENRGREHPAVATHRLNLATLYVAKQDPVNASIHFKEAGAILETWIREAKAATSPIERLPLVQVERAYLQYKLSEESTRYHEVLRYKGVISRAVEIERFAARHLSTELAAVDSKLSQESTQTAATTAKNEANGEKIFIHGARPTEPTESLSEQIKKSPAYRDAIERFDITLADLQKELKAEERLVDFIRYADHHTDRYAAWILGPEGEPVRVELGPAAVIDAAIATFRQAIAGSETSQGVSSSIDPFFRRSGRVLYTRIWKKLAKYLDKKDITTLYLVPDGPLATVPFAALPSDGNVNGREFLIDRYTLAYLSFAQDLVPWGSIKRRGKGVLAIGEVDFDQSKMGLPSDLENRARSIAEQAISDRDLITDDFNRSVINDIQLSPHSGTNNEAWSITDLFSEIAPAEPRFLLRDVYATEDLLRLLAPGRRFLHLATYGNVTDELPSALNHAARSARKDAATKPVAIKQSKADDPMRHCYLAMAGINNDQDRPRHDGALTALEISSLDLEGVELAVLSARNGGIGWDHERVLDLVRGFRQAGVSTMVVNLWPVEDRGNQVLMKQFYSGVLPDPSNRSPAEALTAAMKALRKYKGTVDGDGLEMLQGNKSKMNHRPFNAPKHWAAFVAYGPLR